MRLLNVGCGSNRPGSPWINLDNLHASLKPGTPERTNLDAENNYVDWDLSLPGQMPVLPEFDGILISHVIEHFDCQQAVMILQDCRRVLKVGGKMIVSVPNADYFLHVLDQDTPENAVRLFGEPIHDPWQKSFFDYALFHRDHRQIFTDGALRCLLLRSGFTRAELEAPIYHYGVTEELQKRMNRRQFSLEMMARKFA